MSALTLKHWGLDSRKYVAHEKFFALLFWGAYFSLAYISFALIDTLCFIGVMSGHKMPLYYPNYFLVFFYLAIVATGLSVVNYMRMKNGAGNLCLLAICHGVFFGSLFSVLGDFFIRLFFAKVRADELGHAFSTYMSQYWYDYRLEFAVVLLLLAVPLIIRLRMLGYRMNVQRSSRDTSGALGTAQMATEADITNYGLRADVGGLIGKDDKGYIRYPDLVDRLILAYRGLGKSSSVLAPFILDHLKINKFIIDIKGELAAICARKAINEGVLVYIIDPFDVLKSLGVNINTHCINPLVHISNKNALAKDRFVSSFAAALCSSDNIARTETELHFSENAQIVLEGIIDFYTSIFFNTPEKMNLVELHDWWLEVVSEKDKKILQKMKAGSSKAKAAAAQLLAAGPDESGSMKTTIYRQLQWLRSCNIKNVFTKDEVDIKNFISGNCDIYVILPEDMVKLYSRMVRVIMALIKVALIQATPGELRPDYCFILDELGQFGYCPDVESIINTMRSRGVKTLAAFQTIGQIDVYRDESVFKGMLIKQFLGSDDMKTLEWIQKLGGKTTVLTENISKSTNRQQAGSRAPIVSENQSVSETATDLIHFNDIREMSKDEQYVFIKGMKPIRCKKAYYHSENIYVGRYDKNPIEERN